MKIRAYRHASALALMALARAADKDGPGDEKDPDGDGDAMDKAKAAHSAVMKAGAEKFRMAADKYEAASDTDSASALMAAEQYGDEATEHHINGKASCMKMRGAEMPDEEDPDSKRPAPAPSARAVISAASAIGAEPAEAARLIAIGRAFEARLGGESAERVMSLAALGRVTLSALDSTDPVAALVEVPRKLKAAVEAPALAAERDDLRRARAWDAAIPLTFSAGEVWAQVETNGKRSKTYTPMAAAMNAAYSDVAQLEARIASLPKLGRAGAVASRADADVAKAADQQRASVALAPKWAALAAKAGIEPALLAQKAAENASALAGQEP
jgi:hypothetical protein